MDALPDTLEALVSSAKSGLVVVLSGAGISAESGIPTFRGPEGFWTVGSSTYAPQEMATQAFFHRHPDVWAWYVYRRSLCAAVDFPGEALEILVLAKLPFAPPDEPLVEARCERLRARGEDPFGDFLLPEAVLRFRQGFGRLIRTRQDRGAVLLLDGRLESRAYGETFVASLPVRTRSFETPESMLAHVRQWFASSLKHGSQSF
ncbi:MAG TPA: helicase C-terminal domain-containing protein [Candidatus Krumholzibacteria bacterium]|nr:helicase C-terminal domain-containing protein [Candidatus Krumholzibacteria bacterium]